MRYHVVGTSVFQGEKRIASCYTGDQGQLASAMAERITRLLNDDFERFVRSAAASVDRNPKGEKPQALSAKHESAGGEAETPIISSEPSP